jgi:radical SAM superfamily enzyme YgiQ (UPF0313 family)
MRVLLVSTYELGHQPLHLASPAARLLAEGHEVRCLDLAVEPWDPSRFEWAEAVAFSVPMHTAMRLAVAAVQRLRSRHPGIPIALYGLYAALGSDPQAVHGDAHLIVGEYEDALARWAAAPHDVGTPVAASTRSTTFNVPARHLLPPLDRYARLDYGGEMRLAGYVEASHGCRHRCRHCPLPVVYDGRMRVTGLETVLADIATQVEMGARHVTFGDPDFLNAPRYSREVLEEVHRTFPRLTFDLTVKVEHILEQREIWPGLARAGVLFVVSALETTNDRLLRLLDKGHSAAGMGEAAAVLRSAGIGLRPSWLPFAPLSTPADIGEILDFIAAHHLVDSVDPVQLSIKLLIPSGSLVLGIAEMVPLVDGYDPTTLSHRWRYLHPGLDRLQRQLAAIAEDHAGDPAAGMAAIWELVQPQTPLPSWPEVPAPRLTEDWFCCAEPTERLRVQVGA